MRPQILAEAENKNCLLYIQNMGLLHQPEFKKRNRRQDERRNSKKPVVHIGDGCIIGANSVVASNIPPYSVVVGNPAKVIRKRFDDEMIELLEKLQWWNKPINQIQKLIPLLSDSNLNYVKEEIKHILKSNE